MIQASTRVLVFVFSIALLQLVLQFNQISRGLEHIVTAVTVDDTYYYLKIAQNLHRFGFATFDGIHQTNGVQFAWFCLVALLAKFTQSNDLLLRSALSLAVIFNIACYIPIIKIGKLLGNNLILIFSAFGWFYLNVRYNFYISAMENSLHALILWNMLWALLVLSLKANTSQRIGRILTLCTLLMVLAVWTRIDSIVIVIPICFMIFYVLWRNSLIKKNVLVIIGCFFICAAGAFLMLQAFKSMAGISLPISGLIKQAQYQWSFQTLKELLLRGLQFTNSFLALAGVESPRRTVLTFSSYLISYLAIEIWHSLRIISGKNVPLNGFWSTDVNKLRFVIGCFILGSLIHEIYLAGFGRFALYGVWYQSAIFISAIYIHAFVFSRVWFIVNNLVRIKRANLYSLKFLLIVAPIASTIFITPFGRWSMHYGTEHLKSHHYYRLQAARWIKQNTHPEVIFAAWNTGELGYFSDRTFINLDGLVNDLSFQRDVLAGRKPLDVYLKEMNIEFLVDGNFSFQDANLDTSTRLVRSWIIDKKGIERSICANTINNQSPINMLNKGITKHDLVFPLIILLGMLGAIAFGTWKGFPVFDDAFLFTLGVEPGQATLVEAHSHRPIVGFLLEAFDDTFGFNPVPYIVVNLLFWIVLAW